MNRRIVLATVLLGVCGPALSLAEQHQVPAAAWPADRPSPTAEEIGLHLAASEQRLEERVARVSRDDGKCELFSTDLGFFEDIVTLSSSPNYPVTRVVYIDASAPLDGDGSSWSSAYQSIQDALGAEPYDSDLVEFRVAGGPYRADTFDGFNTLDPEQSIELPGMTWVDGLDGFVGVKSLKGGYAGRGAKNPDERNVDLYPTVFTGDLLGDDDAENFANYEDNTKVLFLPDETELNGITIEFARVAAHELRWMTDCTVRWCFASGDDLPMIRDDRSPVLAREARIVGNTFHNNRAEAYGGALTPRGFTVVANCRFLQNTAPAGGAIGVPYYPAFPSSLKTQNCYFAANSATGDSGGIGGAIYYGPTGGGQVAYCTFVGNWAQDGGGFGAIFSNSRISVQNSIFDQNFAYTGTGFDSEIFFWQAQQGLHTVRACVFRHYNENAEVLGSSNEPFRLNISANPAFQNLLGEDGVLGTLDDDPSLSTESPAIGRSVSPSPFGSGTGLALFDFADLDGDCDRTEPLPVDFFGNPRAFEGTPGEGLDGYAADAGCAEYIPGAEPTTSQDWAFVDPLITDFSTEPIRLHVRSDAAPGGDGLDWGTAFSDLCDALLIAEHRVGPVEVWVASGTYRASCERSGLRAFRTHENVTLLGGFAGNETSADQRDWDAHPTILSGDLLGNDVPDKPETLTDNAHHVVLSVGPRGGGVVDGFTIRDGLPQGYEFGPGLIWGGGLGFNPGPGGRDSAGLVYHAAGELIVRNCTLGRVPRVQPSPSSLALGGQRANLVIVDSIVLVEDSTVQPFWLVMHDRIGEVFPSPQDFGRLLFRRCEIGVRGSRLVSDFWRAGAIEIDSTWIGRRDNPNGSANSITQIFSQSFQPVSIRNSHLAGGAVVRGNDIRVSNSTIERAGFFFLSQGSLPSYILTFSNSIVSGEFATSSSGTKSIVSNTFSDTTNPVYYEGLGDHNTTFDFESNASAFFVDPLGPDGEPYTGDEDLRLAPGSPAINTGLNEFVTSDFDLDGNDRIIGSVVDRGAYEFSGTCTGDVNGDGVIDLGDLNKVLANYGQGVPFGDADGSGSVDMTDLNIVLAAFGSSCE